MIRVLEKFVEVDATAIGALPIRLAMIEQRNIMSFGALPPGFFDRLLVHVQPL